MPRSLLFTVILSRQCNYRCWFCPVRFDDAKMDLAVVDSFIGMVSDMESDMDITIEFSWWEPLLELDTIKYLVRSLSEKRECSYVMMTNGELLDDETISFLNRYGFETNLSLRHDSGPLIGKKRHLFEGALRSTIVSLMIEPGKTEEIFGIFSMLLRAGFVHFNWIPVYYTVRWSRRELEELAALARKTKTVSSRLTDLGKEHSMEYFKVLAIDPASAMHQKEFVFDLDGELHADYRQEMYLLQELVPEHVSPRKLLRIGNVSDPDIGGKLIRSTGDGHLAGLAEEAVSFLGYKDELLRIAMALDGRTSFSENIR